MLRFRSSASQAKGCPTDAVTSILRTHGVLAIVRFHERADLEGTLAALFEGGVVAVEVTLDTPGALQAIEHAARSGVMIGAGTVVTAEEARACADRGARFVVSPGLQREVVEAAFERSIVPLPGVLTPTEILMAHSLGLDAVKLFPASFGGPSYLRTLRGPFSSTAFVPTGGIELDQVPGYLHAGAACVGLGSSLVGSHPSRSTADLESLVGRARQAMADAATATMKSTT